MSTIKPITFKFKQNDTDGNGKTVQLLNTVHRVALMGNARARSPASQTQFGNPTDPNFSGYGINGQHYEAGVQQRTFRAKDSIDDFSDKVTDTQRWTAIGTDLAEGGIDVLTNPPFGLRLFAQYQNSAGVEVFDRKGSMVCANPGGGTRPALSTRITTILEDTPVGVALETCALLGLQQSGSDVDYVFVGYVNTSTHPFSVVMGEVVAGVETVITKQTLPPGTASVSVAIEMDRGTNRYRGWFSTSLKGEDAFALPWVAIGALQASPAGWPSNTIPRFHVSMGAAMPNNSVISFSDCRSEGGDWVGNAQASWFLEVNDLTTPSDDAGPRDSCPTEVMCIWERGQGGQCHLTLLDMEAPPPATPTLWRRWRNIGLWEDWNREDWPWWSPGWMDADEGHIVMTRNTKAQNSGKAEDSRGEIWIFSLRWDAVVVLHTHDIGSFLVYEDTSTGIVMRESGSWGARRWVNQQTFQDFGNYDQARQPTVAWVGLLAKLGTEDVRPALSYGVHIRQLDNGSIGLAYGIQEIPDSFPGQGKCYAGTVRLQEGAVRHYERKLFRKNPAIANLWEHSDEGWIQPRLTFSRALWWQQAREDGGYDEIQGILCRADTIPVPIDNASSAHAVEDSSWSFTNGFGGMCFQLWLEDNVTGGFGEVVVIASGWMANAWLTVLWYDSTTPANSEIRTFSGGAPSEFVNDSFDRRHPYNEFPRWIQYDAMKEEAATKTKSTDTELKECRLDMGAFVGTTAFAPPPASGTQAAPSIVIPTIASEAGILQRAKWKGIGEVNFRHIMMKPRAIGPGDFVIEWEGKLVPPWSAGYGYNVIQDMEPGQIVAFRVGVIGAKRHKIYAELEWKGQLGVGSPGTGLTAKGGASWLQSTGQQGSTSSYTPNVLSTLPGATVKLKISRKGRVWRAFTWEVATQAYVEIFEISGLDLPVVPFIETLLFDAEGLASSAAIEWSRMELAPFGDAVGSQHIRPASFQTLQKVLGEVASGGSVREIPILKTSGSLIIGDAFAAPGLMPR